MSIFNIYLLGYYSQKVIVEDDGHQHEEKEEAYFLGHLPFLYADGLSRYDLNQEKETGDGPKK